MNHRSAPVEIREKMSFQAFKIRDDLKKFRKYTGLTGVVILSTCNRTELFATTTDSEAGAQAIKKFMARHSGIEENTLAKYLYRHSAYDAVRHLYRVVSGLDSMIRGETQILGQVAEAYEEAVEAGVTNKTINILFQNSLAVGKRVRTETLIDQHPVSISYTAIELARLHLGELANKNMLLIGAGEMSALAAKYLLEAGSGNRVLVVNRSYEKAVRLANEWNGEAVSFEKLDECLKQVDIVISATSSPHFMLMPERMQRIMKSRSGCPLLILDIAVPRDIHPEVGQIKDITLFDIDDLNGVVDRHHQERELAAIKAEEIVEEEMLIFQKWHNSLFTVPTIMALQQKGQKIKDAQLEQAFRHLEGLTPKQEKAVRTMANSIVNKLFHGVIVNLKEYANTSQGHLYAEVLQDLFDLDVREDKSRLDLAPVQKTVNVSKRRAE